jgi:hypothetical protein
MSKSSTRSTRATLFLVALLLGASTAVSATTYNVAPAADAFVHQASPNTNYGLDPYLLIRTNATGQGVFSFLRFNVLTLDGPVHSATLRMRVSGTLQEVGYYHVNMGVPFWSESWLTWNNWQSGTSFSYLGSYYWVPEETFLDLDVTGWVSGSTATFAVASSVDSFGQHFYSKDFGGTANDPVLTIETLPPECAITGQTPGDPADLLNELLCVMKGNSPQGASWPVQLDADFSEWNGGSENKPVLAAAVAL